MIDDRFLPRVWTDEGYYYPIFSELGITYENKNLPFTQENMKDIDWAFRWRFNENVDMEYINTLEQCTGLKDKNGKIIYEGDIVKKGDTIAEVFWDDGCYAIRTRDNRVCWLWNNLYEVIGNIHENADLLEVNND